LKQARTTAKLKFSKINFIALQGRKGIVLETSFIFMRERG